MITLKDQVESAQASVVAVVGLAKNCGKTTTVNHLIDSYNGVGIRLGLTSIGRDGEPVDLITQQPKPSIRVEKGTLAVTAEVSLAGSQVPHRVIADTQIKSALGNLLLIEAQGSGLIELSGPTTLEETRKIISLLKESAAERVMIDGALDRLSSSSPSVSDVVILSGGAVLGATEKSVAAKMAHQVMLFNLPLIDGDDAALVIDVAETRGRRAAIVSDDGSVRDLAGSALTKFDDLKEALGHTSSYLWAGGGITDTMVDELLKCPVAPAIIVEDATRVFLSPMSYSRWKMAGGSIRVVNPIRLVALTTNPVRPNGSRLGARKLLETVAQSVPGIPVYDVELGAGS